MQADLVAEVQPDIPVGVIWVPSGDNAAIPDVIRPVLLLGQYRVLSGRRGGIRADLAGEAAGIERPQEKRDFLVRQVN